MAADNDPVARFLKRRARDVGVLITLVYLFLLVINWRETGWSVQTLGFLVGGALVLIMFGAVAFFWVVVMNRTDPGRKR